jgi:hypothetical protein
MTALMIASARGHESCVKLLIKRRANVNLFDKTNRNAYLWAQLKKRGQVLALLDPYTEVKEPVPKNSTPMMSPVAKVAPMPDFEEDAVPEKPKHVRSWKLKYDSLLSPVKKVGITDLCWKYHCLDCTYLRLEPTSGRSA